MIHPSLSGEDAFAQKSSTFSEEHQEYKTKNHKTAKNLTAVTDFDLNLFTFT